MAFGAEYHKCGSDDLPGCALHFCSSIMESNGTCPTQGGLADDGLYVVESESWITSTGTADF